MRVLYPNIDTTIETEDGFAHEMIIENQRLFSEVVSDILRQTEGEKGKAVLSLSDRPVEWSHFADITVQPVPFVLNRKPLLSKIVSSLEKESVEEEYFAVTAELLSKIEGWIDILSGEKSCHLQLTKLSMGSILRGIGIEIDCVGDSELEKIYQYMELVREFDREKIFIFVGMRSYFSDEEMNLLIETALTHGFQMLLIESTERSPLAKTKRLIIDDDLCEF